MTSDDTEHACFTAQALLASPSDADGFARSLAWKLRWWFLGLPAGIGLATLRSILKLWVGFPPRHSGVYSAGNGPAMRSPVIGVFFDDAQRRRAFVSASTRLTHTDPRAERGAQAIALAARYGATHSGDAFSAAEFLDQLGRELPPDDSEARQWLDLLGRALRERWSEEAFLEGFSLPRGVTGYIYHTVPAALWAWLSFPFDFTAALRRVIALGGDTDTTGAICGAISGATAGVDAIPKGWLENIWEFPRTASWVDRLAGRLHEASAGAKVEPLRLAWPWILLRNPLFLAVVLAHGFRRLLPPY